MEDFYYNKYQKLMEVFYRLMSAVEYHIENEKDPKKLEVYRDIYERMKKVDGE